MLFFLIFVWDICHLFWNLQFVASFSLILNKYSHVYLILYLLFCMLFERVPSTTTKFYKLQVSQYAFQKSTGKLSPLEAYIVSEPSNLWIYSYPAQRGFSWGNINSSKIACTSCSGFSTAVLMISWVGQNLLVPECSLNLRTSGILGLCALDASNRLQSMTIRITLIFQFNLGLLRGRNTASIENHCYSRWPWDILCKSHYIGLRSNWNWTQRQGSSLCVSLIGQTHPGSSKSAPLSCKWSFGNTSWKGSPCDSDVHRNLRAPVLKFRVIVAPTEHLAMSGGSFGCHNWGRMGCYCHSAGRGQGCCKTSCSA